MRAAEVQAVDFALVRIVQVEQRPCAVARVPQVEAVVVAGRDLVRVAVVPLDLRGAGPPLGPFAHGPPRRPHVPAQHKRVDGARGQELWVQRVEVDVGDGARVPVKHVLDRIVGRPCQVPKKRFLVGRGNAPRWFRGVVRRPLHVCHLPRRDVVEPARRPEGVV